MKNKRGAELRAEFKQVKNKFLNDLSKLESEIIQSYENTPKDDNFNIQQLYIAIREVDAIKQTICGFDTEKEKRAVAESIIAGIFTDREKEIFHLIIKGHTAQYIADKLSISKRTVERHIRNMLVKICDDDMFSDAIRHSSQFKEFESTSELTKFKKPIKLLKFLYEIVSN